MLSETKIIIIVVSIFFVLVVLFVTLYFTVFHPPSPKYHDSITLPDAHVVSEWEGHNTGLSTSTQDLNATYDSGKHTAATHPKPYVPLPHVQQHTIHNDFVWEQTQSFDTLQKGVNTTPNFIFDWDVEHLKGISGVRQQTVGQLHEYHCHFYEKQLTNGPIVDMDVNEVQTNTFRFIRGCTMVHGRDLNATLLIGHDDTDMSKPLLQLIYRSGENTFVSGKLTFDEHKIPFAPVMYPPTNPVVFSASMHDGTNLHLVGVLLGLQKAKATNGTFVFENDTWKNDEGKILWFTLTQKNLKYHSTTSLDGLFIPPGVWTASDNHLFVWGSNTRDEGVLNTIAQLEVEYSHERFTITRLDNITQTLFEEDTIHRILNWVTNTQSTINQWPLCSTVFTTNKSGTMLVVGEARGDTALDGTSRLVVLRRHRGGTVWVRHQEIDLMQHFEGVRGWMGPASMELDGAVLCVLVRQAADYTNATLLSYRFDFDQTDYFLTSPNMTTVNSSHRVMNRLPLYHDVNTKSLIVFLDNIESEVVQLKTRY